MFDVGFTELLLICVVALLVLGPDKLPGAIRTISLWIGRFRRSFDNIKRDIEKEIGADEIRRQLRNEAILEKFNESKKQLTEGLDAVKKETETVKKDLDTLDSKQAGIETELKNAQEEEGKLEKIEETEETEKEVPQPEPTKSKPSDQ